MKMTLIGRPGDTVKYQNIVVMTFHHTPTKPQLPKGLPVEGESTVSYLVYISTRHWRKAEAALEKDPTERVYIEGYAVWDAEMGRIAVHAQSCYPVNVNRAEKTAKQAAAAPAEQAAPPAPRPVPAPAATPAPERRERPRPPQAAPPRENRAPEPPRPENPNKVRRPLPIPVVQPDVGMDTDPRFAGLPPQAAEQARGLQIAINQYKSKLEALEAKPPEQRFGYEMTKKMLENTEKQLNTLLERHKK